MINYKEEFKKISHNVEEGDYKSVVSKSAWLLEQGLKQLYKDQFEYYEREDCNDDEYNALNIIIEKEFVNFDIDKATLGYIVKFYHLTRFFDIVQNRLDVRLTFTRKLPWKHIVTKRNTIAHDDCIIKKDVAIDFIHYAKVFIYETEIDDRYGDSLKSNKCHECRSIVKGEWNYCANCGSDLSVKCKKCGSELKQSWSICPECKRPRSGVKVKDPIQMYQYYCEAVWADGILTKEEKHFLELKREELGLSHETAHEVERLYTPIEAIMFRVAVEATLVDGVIDEDERVYLRKQAEVMGVSREIANEIFNACLTIDSVEDLYKENKSKVIVMNTLKQNTN
ncbi:MAG: hypothetical protein DRI86_08095 [Bacteroidetes bacterium]|nr:MAG: hypothetical protein DRI86_08095 [Bacteroidota bacterium]